MELVYSEHSTIHYSRRNLQLIPISLLLFPLLCVLILRTKVLRTDPWTISLPDHDPVPHEACGQTRLFPSHACNCGHPAGPPGSRPPMSITLSLNEVGFRCDGCHVVVWASKRALASSSSTAQWLTGGGFQWAWPRVAWKSLEATWSRG